MKPAGWTAWSAAMIAAGAVSQAQAACPTDAQAATVADAIAQQRTIALQRVASPEDAACGRDKIVRLLEPSLGRVVGYKAALTTPGLQKLFDYPSPIRGVLFERMLRRGGEFSVEDAAPSFEADLVVEVGSTRINEATTPLEVLQAVRAVYPFVELPRIVFQVDSPAALGGVNLLYANAGAHGGVLGEPVVLPATPQGVEALANMKVVLTDDAGTQLDAASGAAILGHPLNAVLWLAQDLKKSGGALRVGDLLSLGSFSRVRPAKAGSSVTVRYEGLPGNPELAVRFTR